MRGGAGRKRQGDGENNTERKGDEDKLAMGKYVTISCQTGQTVYSTVHL